MNLHIHSIRFSYSISKKNQKKRFNKFIEIRSHFQMNFLSTPKKLSFSFPFIIRINNSIFTNKIDRELRVELK